MYTDHAFFSSAVHDSTGGVGTFKVRNTCGFVGVLGEQKDANAIAASVGGQPAHRNADGSLTLLDLAETYRYVGCLTAGRWAVVKTSPEAPGSAVSTPLAPAQKSNGKAATGPRASA